MPIYTIKNINNRHYLYILISNPIDITNNLTYYYVTKLL